jgi:hypothetical protein
MLTLNIYIPFACKKIIIFCPDVLKLSFSKYLFTHIPTSVAEPGCLSRIPDPDFYPFRIPDPKTATKERGEKKFVVKAIFVATNFTKLKIIAEENKLGQFSKNYRTFYPKICH